MRRATIGKTLANANTHQSLIISSIYRIDDRYSRYASVTFQK